MILRIAPGEEPGDFLPVAVPDLAEAAAVIGCDIADVRYRHSSETPARVPLFNQNIRPGSYNVAASRYIRKEEHLRVYGVALMPHRRTPPPL